MHGTNPDESTFHGFDRLRFVLIFYAVFIGAFCIDAHLFAGDITLLGEQIRLSTGNLIRDLRVDAGNLLSTSLQVDGQELLQSDASELTVTFHFAQPNRQPIGIKPGESGLEPQSAKLPMSFPMKLLNHIDDPFVDTKGVEWITPISISSGNWRGHFQQLDTQVYTPAHGVTRLVVTASDADGLLQGVECSLSYEVYDDYPVVRKWISIANRGAKWIKLDQLTLEGVALKPAFRHQTILAPGGFDPANTLELDPDELAQAGKESLAWVVHPSVIAHGKMDGSTGIIATSEIPAALRAMGDDGSMGYRSELFEWVVGPNETFVSEPVFYYGYSGDTHPTASSISTPRDQTVEGPYQEFISRHVGVAADNVKLYTPVWSIWEVSWRNVHEAMLREQAAIAARCGFKQIEVDAGWQWDNLGTRIDTEKFPDFSETCEYIESLGLKMSLWVSNYRSEGSRDLELHPELRAVPLRTKDRKLGPGYGMSYASAWREYFARDLLSLHHRYGIIGFKEDHVNIRAGDVGFGHENRTRKESLLRGFRGMFEMKDMVSRIAPELITNITHETYWDMPNPGCDIAALKHGVNYHIPPNTHYGGEDIFRFKARGREPESEFYNGAESESAAAKARSEAFLFGCKIAREQFYAHRALPLRCLQFFALITINQAGSLTPQIQDRQVCSLLMGAPFLFSGDLTTLSEENIQQYAKRFALIERLNRQYDIYKYFQFSGVPAPTDSDWHWWGKLNKNGFGAVVVLRGSGGQQQRIINIPWVTSDTQYRVKTCFAEKELGIFTGEQLQKGIIALTLPTYGQEILEVAPY
jgi:hypothetical protein